MHSFRMLACEFAASPTICKRDSIVTHTGQPQSNRSTHLLVAGLTCVASIFCICIFCICVFTQFASAAVVKAVLTLFQRVYEVSPDCTLRRVYDYYRGVTVAVAEGNPRGNYCRWVAQCLETIGLPALYTTMGCTADLDLADEVSRWKHRSWTARGQRGLLGGQYRHLCRHHELAECTATRSVGAPFSAGAATRSPRR
jgi:hypothetical protein